MDQFVSGSSLHFDNIAVCRPSHLSSHKEEKEAVGIIQHRLRLEFHLAQNQKNLLPSVFLSPSRSRTLGQGVFTASNLDLNPASLSLQFLNLSQNPLQNCSLWV
ncbi:Uncharacterized protein Adt_27597 [Abeliophyllum distichum]|uniref:Uncharacterized protein n=1 Tax=Abeliophyllum distichum TaxID=126358 RepID=A0ABD1RVD0_9LAMI